MKESVPSPTSSLEGIGAVTMCEVRLNHSKHTKPAKGLCRGCVVRVSLQLAVSDC